MELPDGSGRTDPVQLQQEFEAIAEKHLRTHPRPVQARFWLRRFLDDLRPGERALAVKQVYTQLLALWGDQDSHGVYSIDEILGTASVYRLWLAANRCSYRACVHTSEPPSHRESRSSELAILPGIVSFWGAFFPPRSGKGPLESGENL